MIESQILFRVFFPLIEIENDFEALLQKRCLDHRTASLKSKIF